MASSFTPHLHNLHNTCLKTKNWKQSLNHWGWTSRLPLPVWKVLPGTDSTSGVCVCVCVCRQLISLLQHTATQFVRVSYSSTKKWNSLIWADLCPHSCDTWRVLCCELCVRWNYDVFSHIWWTTASWKTGFALFICLAALPCSVFALWSQVLMVS